jgi:hypothetical protein
LNSAILECTGLFWKQGVFVADAYYSMSQNQSRLRKGAQRKLKLLVECCAYCHINLARKYGAMYKIVTMTALRRNVCLSQDLIFSPRQPTRSCQPHRRCGIVALLRAALAIW